MNEPTHLDLFSGIGGFSIAAGWAGYSTRVFCEQDDYCTKVLNRHWPDVPVIPDIRDFDGSKWRGAGLLTGGFPCQPFSVAGKQGGDSDDRHLWPELFRVIREARPDFVLVENVAGLIKMALDDVLSQLEGEGYSTGAVVLPACAVNAPHRRDRVWILAKNVADPKSKQGSPNHYRTEPRKVGKQEQGEFGRSRGRTLRPRGWAIEPTVGRVANGIPSQSHRLKALGNAIVPQVAYEILKLTREITKQKEKNNAKQTK